MPTDEQIRELCARVLAANGSEFETSIRELQSAIRYRLEDLSNQAVATLLKIPRASLSKDLEPKAKTAAASGDQDEQAS